MVTRRPAQGFSLLELMVAMTVALIVVVLATQTFGSFVLAHRRDRERSRLRASADLVLSSVARDLRHAGLGVPEGGNVASGASFPPTFFLAAAAQVGFIADLPRPDAPFNGYSQLAGDQPPFASMAVLLNELSGDCSSDTGASCSTETMSLAIRPTGMAGGGGGGSASCNSSGDAPTCPWAHQRYRGDEKVVVANGLGAWAEMTVGSALSTTAGGRRGLALTSAPAHIVGAGLPRRGFVSTPDRVFYRLDGTAVQRGQCWGTYGSPPAADVGCVTGSDGSGWETLAQDVTRFRLTYLRDGNMPIVLPAAGAAAFGVRSVAIALELSKTVTGVPITLSTETTVAIRR